MAPAHRPRELFWRKLRHRLKESSVYPIVVKGFEIIFDDCLRPPLKAVGGQEASRGS